MSIAVVYQKDAFLEALELSEELGPESDIFERLYIASKFGAYFLDAPGQIFHHTDGGYSRDSTSDGMVKTIRGFFRLYKLICQPEFSEYFTKTLRQKLGKGWEKALVDLVDARIFALYHRGSANYYQAFDEAIVVGSYLSKMLGKCLGVARTAQFLWIKHCIHSHFKS